MQFGFMLVGGFQRHMIPFGRFAFVFSLSISFNFALWGNDNRAAMYYCFLFEIIDVVEAAYCSWQFVCFELWWSPLLFAVVDMSICWRENVGSIKLPRFYPYETSRFVYS